MKTIKFFLIALLLFTVASAISQIKKLETKFPSVKQLMSNEEFKICGLSKLSDQELEALDSWVQKHTLTVAEVVSKQSRGGTEGITSFEDLEGCTIVADDGEFLGVITRNSIDSKSIMNEIGKHGSSISSVSIFNTISKYGSEISSLSPFNQITSKPPRIFNKDGKFLAYLTKNTIKTPRIDPHALIGWLKSK